MKRRIARLFPALLIGTALVAAVPTLAADGVLWVRQVDGSGGDDMAHAVAVSDNAVVAAGYLRAPSNYDDAGAVCVSASGTSLWRIDEEGPLGLDDIFFDAGFDNAGASFYLLGYITVDIQNNTEGLLVKVAGDGSVLWRRAFLPPGYRKVEWKPALAVRDGKAFVAATVTRDLPGGGEDRDIYVASFGPDNSAANWEATVDAWGGPDDHSGVAAAPDGLLVLGTVSNGVDNSAILVRQYAYGDGSERWSRFLYEPGPGPSPGGTQQVGGGMEVSGGKVYVAGAMNDPGTDNVKAALAALDAAAGTERWRLLLGPSSIGGTASAALAAAGGGSVYVAGSRSAGPDLDIFVAAVRDDNTAGDFLWERTFRGPNASNFSPGFLGFDASSSRVLLGAAIPPSGGGVPLMSLRAFRTDTGTDAGSVVVPGGGRANGDKVDSGAPDGAGGVYLAGSLGTGANGDDLAVARIGAVPPPPSGGDGGGCGCSVIPPPPTDVPNALANTGILAGLFIGPYLLIRSRRKTGRGKVDDSHCKDGFSF